MLASLLRRWFTRGPQRAHPSSKVSARQFKPQVERLEARDVPAFSVTNLTSTTTAAMTKDLLMGGTDVVGNVVYTGAPTAAGLFSDPANIVGIKTGIILSSGAASSVAGPNNSTSFSNSNGTPSDPFLNAIIAPVGGFDASVLTFDYTPKGSFVSFTFVFGSEEYPEFAPPNGNIADVFGFFVNGVNVAFLPGTTTPVSITNVNAVTNQQYYVSNTPTVFNTQMDAFTKVMTIALPVNPGVKNQIKLAIQDASDAIYNSWVMIKTGSLRSFQVPAYNPLRFVYTPTTKIFSGTFTVANVNNITLAGPIYMIFKKLPPGVTLVNATGTTPSGYKYIKLPVASLKPFTSVRVVVKLKNPLNANLGTFFIGNSAIVSSFLS